MTRRIRLAALLGLVLSGASLSAHHSIAAYYDTSKRVTIEGSIATFQFVNPHPFITLNVKDASGKDVLWELELDNRSELAEIGITVATFKPGSHAVVSGAMSRQQQTHGMYVYRLEGTDGLLYEQVGFSPRIRQTSR